MNLSREIEEEVIRLPICLEIDYNIELPLYPLRFLSKEIAEQEIVRIVREIDKDSSLV